jgi:autotransporter strand-loop-strand O-heptosyltransferase
MEAPTTDKYITIAPESTSALKMWDNEQWEKTVEYLINMGYKVYNVSYAGPDIKGAIRINRNSKYGIISEITMNYIYHSELFIGLGSGLSWLAWSLNKHVILIANFSKNGHEFTTNVTRINNTEVCNGCWNNPNFISYPHFTISTFITFKSKILLWNI